jgi:hypothetical protein
MRAEWVAFWTAAVTRSCSSPVAMATHVDPQLSTSAVNALDLLPPVISIMTVFWPSQPAAGANMGWHDSSSTCAYLPCQASFGAGQHALPCLGQLPASRRD